MAKNWKFVQVWRHRIGSDPSEDVVVFHETDQSFNVGVYLSRSEKYIFIETGQLLSRREISRPKAVCSGAALLVYSCTRMIEDKEHVTIQFDRSHVHPDS